MALSFIGKPISLISHSDVRYRGILAGIDPAASTIQLSNVYSMGTEMRRPPSEFIPPVQEPYQYIIFRASEVKDLSVDESAPTPLRSVHDDPAVLGASAPTAANGYPQYQPTIAQPVPQQQPQQQPYVPQPPQQQQPHPQVPAPARSAGSDERRTANVNGGGSVQTAAASLETVERALGDLRNSTANVNAATNANTRGGGRRGGNNTNRDVKVGDLRVPTTDFDFEGSNARFDKAAIAPPLSAKSDGSVPEEGEVQEDDTPKAYNPGKSFFDSLSSSTQAQLPAQRGGARGGRGGARNRREEERERNVATFGEPGGVGLMGPGAYVGGWGGFGRRGGGRGRRNPQGQTGTR